MKRSVRRTSQVQKPCAKELAITEEEPQNEADECDVNDHYDNDNDDNVSKGSKESDNEKVIDTMYDNEPVKKQMMRRKSMAPPVLHE